MIDWIQENLAQYSATTIVLVGLAVLFVAKKLMKLAIVFGVLAAAFGAGFLAATGGA